MDLEDFTDLYNALLGLEWYLVMTVCIATICMVHVALTRDRKSACADFAHEGTETMCNRTTSDKHSPQKPAEDPKCPEALPNKTLRLFLPWVCCTEPMNRMDIAM